MTAATLVPAECHPMTLASDVAEAVRALQAERDRYRRALESVVELAQEQLHRIPEARQVSRNVAVGMVATLSGLAEDALL